MFTVLNRPPNPLPLTRGFSTHPLSNLEQVKTANVGVMPLAATLPEPRELAKNRDFGHPTYGTAGAKAFLERLVRETDPRPPTATRKRASRANRATSDTAQGYWKEPMETLLKTYSDILRSGSTTMAADYRKAVIASFDKHSAHEARLMESWFEHASTFLRRTAELMSSVMGKASDDVRPFAEAEVNRHIDRGLAMLRTQSAVPPVAATTASVLAAANGERHRRIAEIKTFYAQALTGDSIIGLPPSREFLTFFFRDGRMIFKDLDKALVMAPRPVFVRHYNYWPTSIRRFNEFRYGPVQFQGPFPTSIEYVDPNYVARFGVSCETGFKVIETDFPLDRDHTKDRYRTNKGAWLPFPQVTTLELELVKANGYAELHRAAELAIEQA